MFVRKKEMDAVIEVLKSQQESLQRQLGMITDLIKLNNNLHTRLMYLEGEQYVG